MSSKISFTYLFKSNYIVKYLSSLRAEKVGLINDFLLPGRKTFMVVMRNDYHREQKWKGEPGAVAGQRRLLSKQKHDVKPGQGLQNHK